MRTTDFSTRGGTLVSAGHGGGWTCESSAIPGRIGGSYGSITLSGNAVTGWNNSLFSPAGGGCVWDSEAGAVVAPLTNVTSWELRDLTIYLDHCHTGNYGEESAPWRALDGGEIVGGQEVAGRRLMDNLGLVLGSGRGKGTIHGYEGEMAVAFLSGGISWEVGPGVPQAAAESAAAAADAAVLSPSFVSDFATVDNYSTASAEARWTGVARAALVAAGVPTADANTMTGTGLAPDYRRTQSGVSASYD